ncbi:unnamed protein product, partial [Ectocarpus sp. 13 AM-2016]
GCLVLRCSDSLLVWPLGASDWRDENRGYCCRWASKYGLQLPCNGSTAVAVVFPTPRVRRRGVAGTFEACFSSLVFRRKNTVFRATPVVTWFWGPLEQLSR